MLTFTIPLSEAFLLFLRDLCYNKTLGDTAFKTLAKNWSMIFCALLEEIDLDPNGDFMVCVYAEIKSITGDLQDEFPIIETIDRLVLQYAVYLGTWR